MSETKMIYAHVANGMSACGTCAEFGGHATWCMSSPVDHDKINHPKHYTNHPSGVECIQITEHYGFNLGNVIKYIWRAEEKGAPLEDLKKAKWYLEREIQKREKP